MLIQRGTKTHQPLHHGYIGFHLMTSSGMQALIDRLGEAGIRERDTPSDDDIPGLHFAQG